jgi:hypothetical protein
MVSAFVASILLTAVLHVWSGYEAMLDIPTALRGWWYGLCVLGVVNIVIWITYGVLMWTRSPSLACTSLPWVQFMLSGGYVLGCAFRSFLPRTDVARFVLVDSWVSSVFVGRSVATIAELCFIVQWAVLLRAIIKSNGQVSLGYVVTRILIPLIVIAELCSWYAVITTSYAGNVFEESIWALATMLVILSIVALRAALFENYRFVFTAVILFGAAYFLYLCTIDVPMYYARWIAQGAFEGSYLSFKEGIVDAATRWTVSWNWDDWAWDIPWMSLYFSIGVWSSIILTHVSWYERERGKL